MTKKNSKNSLKLDQGRLLARRLYDLKLGQLEKLTELVRTTYLSDFPLLGNLEYKDVLRQVIEAKRIEQSRVGWSAIPHDITVLVFVLLACFFDLRIAIIAAVGTLVLFESIFQVYFNQGISTQLSLLVWLTYPAYVVLGWVLHIREMPWYWIALIITGVWAGTFLAGGIARLPMQLIMKTRLDAARQKANTVKNI